MLILCTDDFNRVKLKPVKDIRGSDYINASYVNVSQLSFSITYFHDMHCLYLQGYMTNTKYIAAQGEHITHAHSQCIIAPNSGPLPNTLEDFWKMIMENKLRTIVMLTKCFEERVSYCTI